MCTLPTPGKRYTCLPRIWVMRVRHVKPRWYCNAEENTEESQPGREHTLLWRQTPEEISKTKRKLMCVDREQNLLQTSHALYVAEESNHSSAIWRCIVFILTPEK